MDDDLHHYISKLKHEIDEVALRALKTLHLKTFKTLKIEKSSIGNSFELIVVLLELAPRLKDRESIELLLELLSAAVEATASNQRAKKTILMSNGLRVLTLLAEIATNLRLGPFLAIKSLQDMLMTNSSPTNSGPPPRYPTTLPIDSHHQVYSQMTPEQDRFTAQHTPAHPTVEGAPVQSSLFPVISSRRMRVFGPIEISDQDEERLVSFSNLLSGIPLEEKIEIDLFHIICSRVGPQLFLQRAILLKKIIFGFESLNSVRVERSLYYVSSLLTDWLQLVLKSGQDCELINLTASHALSPLAQPNKRYHTFSNETFMSSFQTDYLPSHITSSSEGDNESEILRRDDFVDLGDASNIIFQCTVGRLRQDTEAFQIIRKSFPFLKIYLESCSKATRKDVDDLCRYITSYFSGILEQMHGPLSSYYVEGVELQLICLGFSLLDYLGGLLEDPSVLSPFVVEYLIQKSPVCVDFICRRILESGEATSLSAVSKIFQMASPNVKIVVGNILNNFLPPSINPKSLPDILPAIFVSRSFSQAKSKENEFCNSILLRLEASLDASEIAPYIAVFQSFYSLDNGRTLSKLFQKCHTQLQPQKIIFFWFRALFSRDESYRNEASSRLESHIGVAASVLCNLFVFPSSILTQMSQSQPSFQNGTPTLSVEMAIKLLHDVKNIKNPKFKEALSVLRFSLQDLRTRSSLIQYGITNMLVNALKAILLDDGISYFSGDLIGCLKIISQCDPKSRTIIGSQHQLLVKLLTVVPNYNEKTKFECARLFILVLFGDCELHSPWDVSVKEHQLNLPVCIVDSFFLYGLAGSVLKIGIQDFSVSFSSLIWNAVSKVCDGEFHTKLLSEALDELRDASSHSDCMISLSLLIGLALNKKFAVYFASHESLEIIFAKFMKNHPASLDDGFVLLAVVNFLSLLPTSHLSITKMLAIIWPLLLQLCSPSNYAWIFPDMCLQFGEALCSWICKLSNKQLRNLAIEQQFLDSCIRSLVIEETRRVSFLSLLIPFCSQDFFLDFLREKDNSTSLIGVLVATIVSRINKPNASFDFQSRRECYISTLLLRNIAAFLLKANIPFWGPHWLYEDSLSWLQSLLNNDNDEFQIAAIGITSTLILSDEAFVELCDSIPYFVDSSVSIVLNGSENADKRKEALLLIGNFFHSLKLRADSTASDELNSEWKRNGFHIIESLFSTLPSVLSSQHMPLRLSSLLLLHNLCCANKHFMRKLVQEYSIYDCLFSAAYFDPRKDVEESPGLLKTICREEMIKSHFYCVRDNLELIARILSILVEGSRDQILILLKCQQYHTWLKVLLSHDFSDLDVDARLSVCGLLCNMFQVLEVQERKFLEPLMEPQVMKRCFSLALYCIELPSFAQRSRAYAVISQIFSWQFAVGRESIVEAALQTPGSIVIGSKLTSILLGRIFDPSAEKIEILAAHNCLEFLLGAFEFAKEIALSSKFYLKAEKVLARELFSVSGATSPDKIMTKTLVSLISRLCANHSTAKITCCTNSYLKALSILVFSAGDGVQDEASESLICLARNCNANAVKMCNNSSTMESNSLLELALSHLCNPACSLKSFRRYAELTKCLFAHKEARNTAVKKGHLLNLCFRFNESIRSKRTWAILGFLSIFRAFSIGREDFLSLLAMPDLGDNLLELTCHKTDEISLISLELLRTLITQRESKAYFLANENTLKSILPLLTAGNTLDKIALTTSFLWVLAYDFEKAKVTLKRHQIEQLLLETQIRILGLKDASHDQPTHLECKRNINSVLSILA